MPTERNDPDIEDNVVGEKVRRGQEVVKTTIELERDLYIKVKEEAARSNTSIRDFMSRAANDRLGALKKRTEPSSEGIKILSDAVEKNSFSRQFLDVIETELPSPFSMAILLSKAEKFELDFNTLSGADIIDELIEEIVRPVHHLSGPDAAKRFRANLDRVRRG